MKGHEVAGKIHRFLSAGKKKQINDLWKNTRDGRRRPRPRPRTSGSLIVDGEGKRLQTVTDDDTRLRKDLGMDEGSGDVWEELGEREHRLDDDHLVWWHNTRNVQKDVACGSMEIGKRQKNTRTMVPPEDYRGRNKRMWRSLSTPGTGNLMKAKGGRFIFFSVRKV